MTMKRKINVKLLVLLICALASRVLAVEKPTTAQKTCVTEQCHTDYSKNAYVHAPVSLGECKSCHEPNNINEHTFNMARKGKDLCEFCHLDQAVKKNVHEPLNADDCLQCHDPHSGDNKQLLSEKTVADLCKKCHQTGQGLKYLHGPMAVGECTVCHESHSSDYDSLLIVEHSELCFSCHIVTKDELQQFEFIHKPAEDNCIGCHDGHGANNPMMLKAESPQLCYPCHEDIEKLAETAKYKHRIVSEQGGCQKCHTPHASTVRFGLKADPMELCVSCHDKPIKISKDKMLGAFSEEIANKKFLHGPVAQKDCKGCHNPHGSEHFKLLEKEYPPYFYSPFKKENYQLCFSCHAETLVLSEKTSDLTNFRNGDVNLHYLHVNKPRRGRTCRACHATHASNLPNHIRKSVPYGMWNLPIQFEKTETGGSCKPGCHLPFAYNRQSPVEYEKR